MPTATTWRSRSSPCARPRSAFGSTATARWSRSSACRRSALDGTRRWLLITRVIARYLAVPARDADTPWKKVLDHIILLCLLVPVPSTRRERWMGLGSVEFVSLAQARERAFELRRQLKDRGVDPLDARKAGIAGARLAALKRGTFEEVARQYVELRSPQWKGDGSRREWLSTLQRYAFPIIGSFSVASIDTALVLRVLEPVWAKKNHVGQRLRERIEAVLEFARSMGLREGENPARWKGHLANVLPKANRTSRTKHHPALPFDQMPEFMAELRALPGTAARALEFTILTAARTGEARFARWSEFDLDGRVWAIPGERMKGDKDHRVPLSHQTLALLRELPRDGDAVFAGRSNGGFLNQDAMADVL